MFLRKAARSYAAASHTAPRWRLSEWGSCGASCFAPPSRHHHRLQSVGSSYCHEQQHTECSPEHRSEADYRPCGLADHQARPGCSQNHALSHSTASSSSSQDTRFGHSSHISHNLTFPAVCRLWISRYCVSSVPRPSAMSKTRHGLRSAGLRSAGRS